MSRRVTRSKSRDEMDTQQQKENVDNEESSSQFPPPSPHSRTPKQQQSSTARTSRTAASLYSPPFLSPSFNERLQFDASKKPDPFPDNWEEDMGTGAPSPAAMRRKDAAAGYPYSGSQSEPSSERKTMMWEHREGAPASTGRGNNTQRQDYNYGSFAADLEMAARDGMSGDDFPAVADCLNLGSFAEESPPRRYGRSPRGSPSHHHFGGDYPYRSSPPSHHHAPYPPAGLPPLHASPQHYSSSGAPPQQQYPPGPPPSMYYQGLPPPPQQGSPYGYPPPHQQQQQQGGPYRYAYQQPSYPGEQWMSPSARFPDYPPPPPTEQDHHLGPSPPRPRSSPPPKKRRNTEWDASGSSSSAAPSPGEEEGSTTPEKKQPAPSPFRSPIPDDEKTKKMKKSPLFQGTPGISAYGSWDTPGGTLEAALGDKFSPMGPGSFAGFGDDENPMPFDTKLSLAASSSGEDPPAPSHPPSIPQRPTQGQPMASPFSTFMGELSPFPPGPPMRGSPVNLDQRDYAARHHPAPPAFHRSPQDDYPHHPGMPTPSKPPPNSQGPPIRPAHPMASPVMSGSAPRPQPWYEHMGPPPAHFRMELGDGKARKGFEDINSLLRGANGPPPPHPRASPGDRFGGAGPRAASSMSTPIKTDGSSQGGMMPGSSGRVFPGSARKTPGRLTPMTKAATPGSKTPRSGGPTPIKKIRRNPCNCKKSKCLKLYCECFAGELYCEGCNCNDCHNTMAYESERHKAMKDTRAKNPNAFKARITVKTAPGATGTPSASAGHNMGCKCKKSECLKKYCECFQAGVMCASKCKCVDCLNYVGSQALIDKRRKMKDHRGAELAMRVADEAWKGRPQSGPHGLNPRGIKPSPAASRGGRGHPMPMPHMMQPGPSPHHRGPPPPHYMGPMMGRGPPPPPPPMRYSPMGMPPVTPGYVRGSKHTMPRSGLRPEATKMEPPTKVDPKKQQGGTPKTVTPRTPAVRQVFDPHSSKKKRKLRPGAKEPTFPIFGDRPEQPKTTALAIFSYLSNDDLFNSTLVCKQWNKLALDDELWQF